MGEGAAAGGRLQGRTWPVPALTARPGSALPAMLLSVALMAAAPSLPPNFILLMSDDMGWGDVSYNNVSSRIHSEFTAFSVPSRSPSLAHHAAAPRMSTDPGAGGETFVVNPPRTPELDAMAKSDNSIQFNRFYVRAPSRCHCTPPIASAAPRR